MTKQLKYEQPLNERIRTFLRMEYLFKLSDHFLKGVSEWDTRSALNTLLDVNDLIARTDIKNELIKELERHSITLRALQNKSGVDTQMLDSVLEKLNDYLKKLRDPSHQPGQRLKEDELMLTVKQRNAILGGTCNFDLPSFHQWLHRSEKEQLQDIDNWQDDLTTIKNSVFLTLHLLRGSTNPSKETAVNGFFQKSLEAGASCQLLRVILPETSTYFPEISGGKHRFTVRFMEQPQSSERPVQVKKDIEFELHCCAL